ncbi:cache domain-containing protein, partial [Campylobacter fetus]
MALDNNGMMYSTGDIKGLPTSNFDARDREWYKNAKNTNKLIITEPYISAANNLVSISAVKPIYINGKFVGVLGADMDFEDIENTFLQIGNSKYGYNFLIDKNGMVLIHPNEQLIGKSFNFTKEIIQKIQNKDFDQYGRIAYTSQDGSNRFGRCSISESSGLF